MRATIRHQSVQQVEEINIPGESWTSCAVHDIATRCIIVKFLVVVAPGQAPRKEVLDLLCRNLHHAPSLSLVRRSSAQVGGLQHLSVDR